MKRVCIETPYAGDVKANLEYLYRCLRHSLCNGEAPFASHAIYTLPGVLDDDDPEERLQGIHAGLAFVECCDLTAVYIDRGISHGMRMGIEAAKKVNRPVVYRMLLDSGICLENKCRKELGRLYAESQRV
jgi:hypothetical protein